MFNELFKALWDVGIMLPFIIFFSTIHKNFVTYKNPKEYIL